MTRSEAWLAGARGEIPPDMTDPAIRLAWRDGFDYRDIQLHPWRYSQSEIATGLVYSRQQKAA